MYQVWSKEEYSETWTKVDCEDLGKVETELRLAFGQGKEPLLTKGVDYKIQVQVREEKAEVPKTPKGLWPEAVAKPKQEVEIEVKESKPAPDKDTGGKGKSSI